MNFPTNRHYPNRSRASGWSFARLGVVLWLVFLTGALTVLGAHTHLDDGQDMGSGPTPCALCLVQQIASAACVVSVALVESPPVVYRSETTHLVPPVFWAVIERSSVSSRAPPIGMFLSP